MAMTHIEQRLGTPPQGERAVFLDKDGTLVEDIPFNAEPDRVRLLPEALEGLQNLHAAGFAMIVVSNQSGVGRGDFAEERLWMVEARLRELLAAGGVPLDGFYYCPHDPDGAVLRYARRCGCRKPEAGMLLQAAADHGLWLEASWMIGDILDDVEAGRRAGCQTILINNGHETVWRLTPARTPDHMAPNIRFAAQIIIQGMDRSPALVNRGSR